MEQHNYIQNEVLIFTYVVPLSTQFLYSFTFFIINMMKYTIYRNGFITKGIVLRG